MEKAEILSEKENDSVATTEVTQGCHLLKNLTRNELQALKREVRSKIARSDATLSKLDQGFEDLKVCVVKMTSVIEECQNLVKAEKQETKDLRYILRDTTCSGTCKTNVVNPMIGGVPLKKARVSLKRLGPAYLGLLTRGISNGSSVRTSNERAAASKAGPSSRSRTRV